MNVPKRWMSLSRSRQVAARGLETNGLATGNLARGRFDRWGISGKTECLASIVDATLLTVLSIVCS